MKFKNVVLIGLGRQGKTHFCALKELLEMGFIEKIYISDEDPNCLEALGEEWSDTIIYITERDYQTITDVLFIIATPNNTHLQILSLLKSGATILKEKPFAIDQDNFLRLQKLILDKKFNVHIAQQRYFNESYLKAKLLLSNLGKVNFFEYRYTLNDSEESWYWKKELGGGCLLMWVGIFFFYCWFFEDTSMLIDVQSFKLSNIPTSDVKTLLY
jgi:predicted dehydrogenase